MSAMDISGAFVLIATGAILKWAVTAQVDWINLQTTGTVLLVVGLVALPLALLFTFWSPWRERREEARVLSPPSTYR